MSGATKRSQHFNKYHANPDSDTYLGTDCVNCIYSENSLREQLKAEKERADKAEAEVNRLLERARSGLDVQEAVKEAFNQLSNAEEVNQRIDQILIHNLFVGVLGTESRYQYEQATIMAAASYKKERDEARAEAAKLKDERWHTHHVLCSASDKAIGQGGCVCRVVSTADYLSVFFPVEPTGKQEKHK